MIRLLQKVLLVALALAPLGAAHAHADVGTVVQNAELKTAAGGKERLLAAKVKATAVVFVRTGQERSADALKAMAKCEQDLAGKPVRFVAVVSGDTVPADALALAAAAGVRMPVLLDEGEVLYERFGVRNHPVIFLLDAKNAIAAFEQYRQIDYCEVIKARLRLLLGEIDQAAMDKVLDPPTSSMPGDDARDVSNRDVNLGRRQLKIKQYEKALQSASKALERAPSAGAFALIGDVHAAQGDCPKALKAYEQALKLDPAEKHALAGQQACAGK
ncbi:MAG: redoxin domain-containing protein [Anaeromyxobacteraceae bacterium]|nr:redoxin domain-containing protein [Anaeromyxobacteraceae bacterium]